MKKVAVFIVATSLVLSACSSTAVGGFSLTGNSSVKLGAAAVVAAAVYLIYDPLAPNWEIEESRLSDDTYRFSLKMKRFHTGGAGESLQILKRRASQLQHEYGHATYQIVEYTEGIDSQTLGARRVAEATIRFAKRDAPAAETLSAVNAAY